MSVQRGGVGAPWHCELIRWAGHWRAWCQCVTTAALVTCMLGTDRGVMRAASLSLLPFDYPVRRARSLQPPLLVIPPGTGRPREALVASLVGATVCKVLQCEHGGGERRLHGGIGMADVAFAIAHKSCTVPRCQCSAMSGSARLHVSRAVCPVWLSACTLWLHRRRGWGLLVLQIGTIVC